MTSLPEGQPQDEPNPSPEAMMQALIDGPANADGASPEATSDAAPSQPVPIPVPEAPTAPSEQAPAETPPPPSAEILEAQRQLAERDEQIAAFQRQAAEQKQRQTVADQQARVAEIQQNAAQYKGELETTDGLTPELANRIAQERANHQYQILQMQQESGAKVEAAQAIATQYGISPEALMAMDSPGAMQSEAKRLSETGALRKEMADMRAEMARTLAPIQTFAGNSGATPATPDDATRIARMGDRENPEAITDDSIKWFKDYIAQG